MDGLNDMKKRLKNKAGLFLFTRYIITSPEPGDKLQMGYKSILRTDEGGSK